MRYAKLNGETVVVAEETTIDKAMYYSVLLNGSWQNVRASKLDFKMDD